MAEFLRSRFGSAVFGAVAIMVGVFISGAIGLTDAPTTSSYLLGAVAGFAGGYVGAVLRERREAG